jgi:peptidoglycan/LPS O-acetylase OafA/YrhL
VVAGNEAGTPPGDRKFRPDVQGMRAIAILLALVYHAGLPGFSGGYVGIEVFFVISGFVITGLLLREREGTGGTSLRSFYGRRARRIIPAATLVIIVTVIVSFHSLGPLVGHETAIDGLWAALFLANVHFAAVHTNYLVAQAPPSPLLNYWSLGVEEQFYIVYPTLFLLIGWARKRSFRQGLTVVLVAVIVASYAWSILLTSTNAPSAYFSLFTRAWELALGGLIAVHGRYFQRIPQAWAAVASWAGLIVILVSSVTLSGSSAYPGALVAIPTLGAGLVIAAGAAQPTWGVERMLARKSFQFLAAISFPLYLWHWPILEIAAQSRGVTSLPAWESILLLLFAGVIATLTYYLFENPIRHSRYLAQRRWASLTMGLCLIAATLAVTTYEQRRPTVDLGILAGTSGSNCDNFLSEGSHLRSTYLSDHHDASEPLGSGQSVVVIGDSTACTLLPGLAAVGPSYGLQIHTGAVLGCGIVSGQLAPFYVGGLNVSAGTAKCQSEADSTESAAIKRFKPRIIVWGSTDERNSVVANGAGSEVVASGSRQWQTVMLDRLNSRVERLLDTGAKVILVLEPAAWHRTPGVDSDDLAYQHMNALLQKVAEQHPNEVGVVNLQPRVCPSGPPCAYVVPSFNPTSSRDASSFTCGPVTSPVPCGQTLRPDGIHYTQTSSLWVAQ